MARRRRIFSRSLNKRNRSGLTLIEVITAAAIFAFCLSGLLLTYINLFTLTDLTRDFTIATNAMQSRMEEIKRVPFINLGSLENATFAVAGFSTEDATGITRVTDTAYSDLKEVRLIVSFRSRNRVIGPDQNLNGLLNASESAGSSPCELATYIANFN